MALDPYVPEVPTFEIGGEDESKMKVYNVYVAMPYSTSKNARKQLARKIGEAMLNNNFIKITRDKDDMIGEVKVFDLNYNRAEN